MKLAELFGEGAKDEFELASDGGRVTETPGISGLARVLVDWEDGGHATVMFSRQVCSFLELAVPSRQGRYTRLCEAWAPVLRKWGVEKVIAATNTKEAEAILRKRGHWRRESGVLIWTL